MENDNPKKSFLWKNRISEIPCFRNSYLYGISSGIGAGIIYFMFTSKVKVSSHISVAVFATTTLAYWTYCRYKWETDVNTIAMVKEFLRDRVNKEGTTEEKVEVYNVSAAKDV